MPARSPAVAELDTEEQATIDFGAALWRAASADEESFKPTALGPAPECWEDEVAIDIDAI